MLAFFGGNLILPAGGLEYDLSNEISLEPFEIKARLIAITIEPNSWTFDVLF